MFTAKIRSFLLVFLFLLVPICIQAGTAWDAEYLPSVDEYEPAFGTGIYHFKEEGISFYGNFQLTLASRESYYESLNMSSYGDPVTDRIKEIYLMNLGITKEITSNIGIYAGVGFVYVKGIGEKYDSYHILSSDGKYYVDDPDNDDTGGNLNAGIIFGFKPVSINIGYHSYTKSFYFGIGIWI